MEMLNPPTVMKPSGGYSQGIAVGELVFVAGQVGVDQNRLPTGSGDMADQTRQALKNVENVLAAAGASLGDVVSTTVFVSDFAAYGDFDRVWQEVFGDHRPARATVRAELVAPALLVEIQAIAVKGAAR